MAMTRRRFGDRTRERRTEIGGGAMYGSAFTRGNQTSSFENRRQMIGLIPSETQGPRDDIHGRRATGHRCSTIGGQLQADYNGHGRRRIQWTNTNTNEAQCTQTRSQTRVSTPMWPSRRGRTNAPGGGGLASLRTQRTRGPHIAQFLSHFLTLRVPRAAILTTHA